MIPTNQYNILDFGGFGNGVSNNNFQGVLANANLGDILANDTNLNNTATIAAATVFDGAGDSVQTMTIAGAGNIRLAISGIPGLAANTLIPGAQVDEIQRIVNNGGGSGTFQLSYLGAVTAFLDTSSTKAAIQDALDGILGFGNSIVTNENPNTINGGPWLVEFTGTLGKIDIKELTDGLKVEPTQTGNANVSIQVGPNFPTTQQGGLQTVLPFVSNTKPTAQQLQNNLLSLPALGGDLVTPLNNVKVIGGPGGPFTIIFNGTGPGGLANTPGITLSNGTGNTTTNSGSNVVGQPAAVTVGPAIAADVTTTDTVIAAVNVQSPITPSVNTEVQRLVFNANGNTTAGTFRRLV